MGGKGNFKVGNWALVNNFDFQCQQLKRRELYVFRFRCNNKRESIRNLFHVKYSKMN